MSDTTVNEKSQEPKSVFKKKGTLFVLIVLCVILLLAVLVIGGSFIVPKNITGAWELVVNPELPATQDEIPEGEKVYYVFDKADRYGRGECRLCYQGGVECLKYELLQEDEVQKINLGAKDMEYIITGSKLLGNAELTLIYPEYTDENTGAFFDAQEYVFEQAENPVYEKSSYKDYEVDEKLINKWASNERSLEYYYYKIPYVETVEFTENGVMIINYYSTDLGLDRYMYYAYSADGSQLTFSLVTDKETKYTIAYEFDQKGNLKFINDTTSASIFADAFFGDFTFYTAENLPEPTEASDDMYFTE